MVPGTDLLTDVAAKEPGGDIVMELGGDIVAMLDGEIGDATSCVEVIRSGDGGGGAGINTSGAGAAAIDAGRIVGEVEGGDDLA